MDELLGLEAFGDDFDKVSSLLKPQLQMDEHFALDVCIHKHGPVQGKRRRMERQKVWISQLQDFDKLYKPAELRDIKLDAFS